MKKRVLSAIVMLLVFIPLLLIGGKAFAVFMSLLAIMGLYEILNIRETKKNFPFMMKVFAYILVVFYSLNNFTSSLLLAHKLYKLLLPTTDTLF